MKYRVVKETIIAPQLNDDLDKFYSNSIESMKKLLKHCRIAIAVKRYLNAKNQTF